MQHPGTNLLEPKEKEAYAAILSRVTLLISTEVNVLLCMFHTENFHILKYYKHHAAV